MRLRSLFSRSREATTSVGTFACRWASSIPPPLQFKTTALPPLLQREFDTEANAVALKQLALPRFRDGGGDDLTPVEVVISPSTVIKVQWKCSACQTQWAARPSERADPQVGDGYGCPRCSIDAVKAAAARSSSSSSPLSSPSAFRLLHVAYPLIAAQWDQKRNQLLQNRVTQGVLAISASSSASVWWRCSLCHSPWAETVISRVRRYAQRLKSAGDVSPVPLCPKCERRSDAASPASAAPPSTAKVASCRPRRFLVEDELLLSEAVLRPDESPHEISLTSEKMLSWRCQYCQFDFQATVANRFLRHERCPQCSGQTKTPMNLLVVQRPDLVAEVSKEISRTRLASVAVFDDVELPFVCRICYTTYRMTARVRCAVPRGVPACSNCFLMQTQVAAEAAALTEPQQAASSRDRYQLKRKALDRSRSGRHRHRLALAAHAGRLRDRAVKN